MKKVYYNDKTDLEGLKWTARVVDFGVGLLVTAAVNEMHNTYALLVERRDILHGKVKRFCNNAFREARIRTSTIKDNMVNKQFWLDYSDRVIDEADNDITMFRIAIKQTLDNANAKDSEIISHAETTRTMLDLAVGQFDEIMKLSKERYGRDYSSVFSEYRLNAVLYWWTQMCDILCKGIKADMNNKNTTGLFDKMCDKFGSGAYIQACLQEAYKNNPDFIENSIAVS